MILNISGRTDIVAFYSTWLKNRMEEGYFDVRNPFNPKLVSRIYIEDVDMYAFCTKNPIPILPIFDLFQKPIYFMVTLTGYHEDIEPNVGDKKKIIEAIIEISKRIGKKYTVLRYDPILLNDKYTKEYHVKALEKIASSLKGTIEEIIISFVDNYKNVRKNMAELKYHNPTKEEYLYLAKEFNRIEEEYHISIKTCLEDEAIQYGFHKGECISQKLAYELTGKVHKKWKERPCGCAEIVDIGVYNSCNHRCKYCYANFDEDSIISNMRKHDPKSSLLIGHLEEDDVIKRRVK